LGNEHLYQNGRKSETLDRGRQNRHSFSEEVGNQLTSENLLALEEENIKKANDKMKQKEKEMLTSLQLLTQPQTQTQNQTQEKRNEDNIFKPDETSIERLLESSKFQQSSRHPIVLFLHIVLTLFQLERHLCSKILDYTKKNEIPLEFDEFFAMVINKSLDLVTERVDNVLKIKDNIDFVRSSMIPAILPSISKMLNSRSTNVNEYQNAEVTTTQNVVMSQNQTTEEIIKHTAIESAQASIQSDSVNSNMLLTKFDLARTWHRLYSAFNKVLNGSGEYGSSEDKKKK